MTSTDVGFLWFIDENGDTCEILNDNRTRHYQALHPLWTGDTCTECQCASLDFNPCTGAALTYGATPADGVYPAPWYDNLANGADTFLGWIVSDVDGFDYAHYSRSVNQRAQDGANFTPMRASGREITYTLIGTALDEVGMNYGMNWLATNLLSLGGRCSYGRVLVKPWCDGSDLESGLFELREVALTQAPSWTENYLAEKGCMVREARFTIVAGDPCLYGCRSTCSNASGLTFPATDFSAVCAGVTIQELICGPLPVALSGANAAVCCSIPAVAVIDSRAATVTISANGTVGPFTVETYSALPGTSCATVVGNVDLYVGRVSIGRLYAGQSVQIDGVSRQVFYRASASSDWEPNDSLLLIEEGDFPCFPRAAGCDDLVIAVRPGTACPSPGTFSVKIESVVVTSCTMCG